jgi:hypothetical protein
MGALQDRDYFGAFPFYTGSTRRERLKRRPLGVAHQSHLRWHDRYALLLIGSFNQQKVLAMGVHIPDPASISWIWHDAALDRLQIEWSTQGDMRVVLHTELNPEEDTSELASLGIDSQFVSIFFGTVWRFQIDSTGDYTGISTIDAWDVRTQSSLLALVNRQRPPIPGLVHHHITTSSGSTFDIVCSDMRIEVRDTLTKG